MGSGSFPWIQMAQLHHTWQLRITSRRACIPSMVLSFKAMARRTGLFPASCDTNATRFLAQTWTRGWKAKGYRCTLIQMGESSCRSQERKSPGVTWRTCWSWTQTEQFQHGQQRQAMGQGTSESTFLASLKGKSLVPWVCQPPTPPWNNFSGAALELSSALSGKLGNSVQRIFP